MERYYDYKFPALKRARTERTVRAIERGKAKTIRSANGRYIIVICVLLLLCIISAQTGFFRQYPVLLPISITADIIAASFIAVLILYFVGRPPEYRKYEEAFTRLGFVDAVGLPPEVIEIIMNKRNFEMHLMNCGKSLSEWQDSRAELETALGVVISKVLMTRGEKSLTLICVPPDMAFRADDSRSSLQSDGLKLNIGYKAEGAEIVDLNRTAHILIGGATGSGKTVLLRTILVMLIHRGCDVIICDFKGGIDFPEEIWSQASLITTYDDLIKNLEQVIFELEDRKREFLLYGVKNIEEYNKLGDTEHMEHIAVATDEVAEMLDRTGRKEEKAKINKVTEMLSTVARLGRAYGIHLILATQRPDANVIPGQIKNNLTYRACGHADKILSQIVIDCTDASEIPADCPGRFVTDTGEEFQARMLNKSFFQ